MASMCKHGNENGNFCLGIFAQREDVQISVNLDPGFQSYFSCSRGWRFLTLKMTSVLTR
jgi:hypothetical protein